MANQRVQTTNLNWIPFLSLFRREVWRFWKVFGQTVFTPLVNSSLYLMIFGVSLGKSIVLDSSLGEGLSYLAFLIPGLVMMAVLNNSFQNASSSIAIAKFQGELEDLKVAPLSAPQIVWAFSLGALLRGLIVCTMTYFVGTVFCYYQLGHFLAIAHPFLLLLFIFCGGLTFAKLGLAVAVWAKNFDQLGAVSAFVLMPLIYLGGVFFSLKGLHPVWQMISKANPLLYFINGVRHSILGVSDVPVGTSIVVTLVSLVFFHLLALRIVSRGEFARW